MLPIDEINNETQGIPDAPAPQEEPTLKSVQNELNALKRKFARLQKENENVTHLYKQAASLRDFNEKEKGIQMRYNQLLRDNSPDEILLLDTDLNILLCTLSVKKAFERDITGEAFLDATRERFGPEYADDVKAATDRLLNSYKDPEIDTDSCELHVITSGEKKSFFSITVSPALDNNGELTGIVILAHDNTEMHDANLRAEAANKAKSDFLSTMSHEIRTPMNAILGITEIQLQNDSLDASVKEALNKIYSSGDLLLGIINDILDLSKIEAGKLELIIAKYEIASLISDTAQLNIMRIGSKPIEFEIEVDENLPTLMMGDELRVKQILNNILSNAFKYTAEGVVKLTVLSEASTGSDEETTLSFSVSDTGQGMTPEQVEKLFDEFSRFNLEANRTTEGTGLGMSITRNLILLMNGEILIDSEPGVGSTFTVRLPQGKLTDDMLGSEMAENLRQFRTSGNAQMKHVQITREPMPYGSVLIVDDVETNIYVAKGLMAPYGLNMDSAESGFEAIDKVIGGSVYDIIFMDHMMPQMDGIEATQKIRAMGYAQPIVALTANAVAGQAEVFLSNGFDDFISKPIDVRQLNTVLNTLIRDKQTPETLEAARLEALEKEGAKGTCEQNGSVLSCTLEGAERSAPDAFSGIDPAFAEIFVRDALKSLAILEEISGRGEYGSDDLRSYIINVHGMKSALANIKETGLSERARKLEESGREENNGIILEETPSFLADLRGFVESLIPEPDAGGVDAVDEDAPFLREKLLEIKAACEDYDESAVDGILAKLKEKQWSQATKTALIKIAEHMLHSDFDEAVKAADEIISAES